MFYLADKTSGKIKAAYQTVEGIPINGFHIIEVPSDIGINESDVASGVHLTNDDVIRQKYEALLSNRPPFTGIIRGWDDISFSTLDKAGAGENLYWLEPGLGSTPVGGELTSSVIDVLPSTPLYLGAYWDIYTLTREKIGGITEVYYSRVDPLSSSNPITVSISNDGGSSYKEIDFMNRLEMDAADSNIRIKLRNNTTSRLYIGGLAVLY